MNRRTLVLPLCLLLAGTAFAQEKNIALHKPISASSERAGFPAANMVDGKISRTSKWEAATGKAPHIVEVDLRKYYSISEVRVHTGIRDEEKRPDEMTQAAGFWSAKNFKLQYWDDANWTDFPGSEVHENRLTTVQFTYKPAITTFRIRLVCDDGEPINIMEIEAFGDEAANMPAPPAFTASVKSKASSTKAQRATITVGKEVVGRSLKYVGYNQGYYLPGSNASAWVEYSGVNGFRVWATMNSFVPQAAVQVDKGLASVSDFDRRKAELRASPERNAYIKWNQLLPLYDLPDTSSTNAMVYSYALTELKRLGIDVILQMGSTDFSDSWENKWKQWQRYYALAYYSAKTGDVSMFAMQNEPNHRNSGPMKLDQWIGGMQVVSDAIHCAVEDVNKAYGKKLVPRFVGPVTAGNNPEWWAGVARAIRTDYHGNKVDKDLLEVFSTHSYNSPAAGYESRISNIRQIIQDNHPAGRPLPIVYTEIGRWMNAYLIDKEETMDAPSLFTEWAGIYANNMKNGGYGMFAFKFATTASGTYPEGIKSGHHYVWHGRRIVEDAYTDLALGRPARTSNASAVTRLVTDGNKSDASTWVSDSTATGKWIEIDLGKTYDLGSAIIYTGDASGVFTSPSRARDFRLQYLNGSTWKDIAGAGRKDNKYAQLFIPFASPVHASRLRFVSEDAGRVRVREIKVFALGDGPKDIADYNVSGIQRTGEVVRLFAKGFKNERPLLRTASSVRDSGLDSYTSYDSASGNYYMWLVQRDAFAYNLTIDLASLGLAAGTPAVVETVGPQYYGEVTNVLSLSAQKKLTLTLQPQSVMLVTIPANALHKKTIQPSAGVTVAGGSHAAERYRQQNFSVQLNAAQPEKNEVTYISFRLPQEAHAAGRILLKVTGGTDNSGRPFRFHVYGLPGVIVSKDLVWKNAPLLDASEALVKNVGQEAWVAGELAFGARSADHWLDVTDLVNKHASDTISFVLVRETREMGDDEDKGRRAVISASGSTAPELIYWIK